MISGIEAIDWAGAAGVAAPQAARAPAEGFGAWFGAQLAQVNSTLQTAELGVRQLAAGEPVELHQVMIGLEEAKLSLQLMMQVRSTLLESYQELMRTPL